MSLLSSSHRITKQFIILCIVLCVSVQAHASSEEELLNAAKKQGLAEQSTWRKLLHYEGKQSVVLTDSFFLSPYGKKDPGAELVATIHAYFLPWRENPNEHARCKFPARYYWLNQQLCLPDYDVQEDKCQRLQKWALFNSVNSISVMLVSGYFGNPASTFGHAFLKFNTDSSDDKTGLFDLTLSYGAMVPESENGVRYIIRGLFGGYQAGFSDKYFYTQDQVYSRTEFRDVWDYRLKLTDYQRKLLMLHIWEIAGSKFDYYFLDKNCAYRLAELLELVIDKDFVHNGLFWYLPLELFYRLQAMNLIQSVRFVPSSQRVLYHQLKLLTPREFEAFNAIIKDGSDSISVHLETFAQERQLVILDSLLAYQQYRLIAEEPKSSNEAKGGSKRQAFKDQILLARLQLPAHERQLASIKELPSPAEGSRPMVFGIGIASDKEHKHPFLRLNWSPFKQEMVGQNSLEGNEFVILDMALGLSDNKSRVFVDQVDLVRILKLNTLSMPVVDENRLSWQLRLGSNRIEKSYKGRYDGVGSFGVGYARNLNKNTISYGMVDFAGHTIEPYGRLRPHLGLRFDLGMFKVWTYGGAESANYSGRFREVWGGKMQFQLTQRCSLEAEVSNEKATRTSLGLNWYW